ncbi:MAG: hypothetical protein AAF633_28215 [Chloroflexota bacterium]
MKNRQTSFQLNHIIIFVLSLVTALIHLIQGDPVLTLNAVGYIAMASAILFPIAKLEQFKRNAPQMLSVYAFATIILYFAIYREAGLENIQGVVAKSAEGLLILFLFLEMYLARRRSREIRFRSRPVLSNS